ncbi:hypothetical protein N8I77_013336 [Diaporthe amygdali]|uniref:Heterokaryon incompatibility domain-containing protein n=1 Tax=Phomopsis amygdali TaxID=1214568 RepID=A0AAD9S2I8_PHOAM|nr:hypothetical protein N8I77_013336 [Diaporthe amygdali]
MLCRMCRDNLGNVSTRYNHHNSTQSFYNAIEANCFICRNIWQKIVEVSDSTLYESGDWVPRTYEQFLTQLQPHLPSEDVFWNYASTVNPPELNSQPLFSVIRTETRRHNARALDFAVTLRQGLAQMSFRRVQNQKNDTEPLHSSECKPLANSWSTSQNPHLWAQWLRRCSTSHNKCRSIRERQYFSPSRLVEIVISDGKATGWRIVEQAADDPRPYCTLSHCWGKSLHFCLGRDNYSNLLAEQDMMKLPKTYREACEIATSLGFSHIWIDSLCIIQDDVSDWEKESALMGQIYEGAVVNIAATWAADGSLGLYHGRDPATLSAPDIGEANTTLARLRMYTDDIEEAPLNTRAWVLQERYLAPGQLSFTRNQVYWECQELMACEQFPEGMPAEAWDPKLMAGFLSNYRTFAPPVGKPSVDLGDIASVNEAWWAMVKAYSSCYLTKTSDKLVALAGLAGKVRETLKDTYLAGMWRNEILSQVCWNTYSQHDRAVSRIRGCWIPTWSWASLDGPIVPDLGYGPRPGHVVMDFSEVLGVHVATDHPSGLYNFTSCRLHLRAVCLRGRLFSQKSENSIHETNVTLKPLVPSPLLGDSGTPVNTIIDWDEYIPRDAVRFDDDVSKRI